MERPKKQTRLLSVKNSKLYMDLKDIIRENALPFLPAKSLFRSQGVCRDWKLQISTPFFAHNQTYSCRQVSGIFIQIPGNPPSFISIDPNAYGVPDPSLKFLPVPIDIRSSSNGLVCCLSCSGDNTYYICNPVTRRWKSLPKPNANHGLDPAVVLVFEPSLLNFEAEYKLVCAFPSADFDEAIEFEIYSSRENSWRVSGEMFFCNRTLKPRSGVYVNGVVYWRTINNDIISFDLVKERALQVSRGYSNYSRTSTPLGEMGGKLCKASVSANTISFNVLSNIHTNTMQMNSNVSTWTSGKTIQLDYKALQEDANNVLTSADVSEILFFDSDVLLGRAGKVIFAYDMKEKVTKFLSKLAHEHRDMRIVSYVNNLVYI